MDVILIVGDNVKQLMGWIKSVFERCQDHGITLSNTKFQVGSKVKFAGYLVSDKGKEPDPDKIAAIVQFPRFAVIYGIGEPSLRLFTKP